ncbi:FAD/NAD(P)-binding protein [Kitasatospora sp. NBC_01560]|uniref:FAD/NAD(P)-binding protein n=1 Tax=Kitasatospora sp. NBC_01560 TaxID=2975965 RepID=UPI00386D1B9F
MTTTADTTTAGAAAADTATAGTATADTATAGPRVSLALVGGGPSSTYVLDRLAATAHAADGPLALDVHVFDRSGQFGAGQVHSPDQPVTSFLNRIVGQVAFAADESVADAGPLLDPADRPTLLEWCRARFLETGDPVYDLSAEDWPKRYVHGEALRDRFERYVALLRERRGVRVHLHRSEVVDLVERGDGRLEVVTAGAGEGGPAGEDGPVLADHVLMLTGHSSNDPLASAARRGWIRFAARHSAAFVPSAYPLENAFGPDIAGPGTTVGCLGMGLTAIDVVLHLTEGRGGRFAPRPDGSLEYLPSGAEPASVAVFSRSGLFTFARPYNGKERDPERLEHRGVFLTERAVERLRASAGRPARVSGRVRSQLDFRRHLLPLVILEMAHLYYTTFFGQEYGRHLEHAARPQYESFLADGGAGAGTEASVARLLAPLEEQVDRTAAAVDAVLAGGAGPGATDGEAAASARAVLPRYLRVVFGPERGAELADLLDGGRAEFAAAVAASESPYRHGRTAAENRFSWRDTVEPLPRGAHTTPQAYREAVLDFFDLDHRWAAQDNLWNPAKAAADGVWRDLRDVLAAALDFGGLHASSHRDFLDVFMRHHNRLCNGAALEVMEKIRALVRQGLVDVSAGPDAEVHGDEGTGRFRVRGPITGADIPLHVLVDSRVHPFDAEHDVLPLYPNLLRRGLVRIWRNPGIGEPDFVPGGLDLTDDFHPVRADGSTDRRLTLLGPPSEGVMFFQLGALRPNQNHHVMQDILCWLREFWPRAAAAPAAV